MHLWLKEPLTKVLQRLNSCNMATRAADSHTGGGVHDHDAGLRVDHGGQAGAVHIRVQDADAAAHLLGAQGDTVIRMKLVQVLPAASVCHCCAAHQLRV